MPYEVKDDDGLTHMQRVWVDTMVTSGCSRVRAAEMAGYAKGSGAKTAAFRNAHLPHVQAYMQKRVMDEIGCAALSSVATLARLVDGAKSEYVQLAASKDVLDRAGFKPVDRANVRLVGDMKVSIDLS